MALILNFLLEIFDVLIFCSAVNTTFTDCKSLILFKLFFISLLKFSNLVVTDSGGLQKEAFFHNKNCIILRNETEWSEIKTNNKIINISNFNLNNLKFKKVIKNKKKLFGNGKSGNNILNILLKVL